MVDNVLVSLVSAEDAVIDASQAISDSELKVALVS